MPAEARIGARPAASGYDNHTTMPRHSTMGASGDGFRVLLAAIGAVLVLSALAACDTLRSDSQNALRQTEAEQRQRTAALRAGTLGAVTGTAVTGEALRELLSGRTHVFVYQQTPGGQRVRYVEYYYFGPDGHLVFMNNRWAKDPAGHPEDNWRVDRARVCILSTDYARDAHCYRLAVLASGRIQYFIDSPGSDTDGLLTKVTDAVQDGPPDLGAP